MHLESLTDALICLRLAFDPKETPQGAAFWLDVRRRLNDYREAKFAPHCGYGDHSLTAPMPNLAGVIPLQPSVNHGYCYAASDALALSFNFDDSIEGRTYWAAIYTYLHNSPCPQYRDLDSLSELTYCPPGGERYRIHHACGWLVPSFIQNIWYNPGQFPHHDPENPELVRYIPLGKPALSKHFISAKPGKFLATHYGDSLTDPLIAELAAKFRSEGTPSGLLIARTADEIAHVYATGPNSCMAAGKKIEGIEPVRAYASPDLGVAYIMRDDKPSARTLVWPERKVHSRIYGDATALKAALRANGYTDAYSSVPRNNAAFDGARLAPLRADKWRPAFKQQEEKGEPVLVAPFFDLTANAHWDGEWLRIGPVPPGKLSHRMRGGFSIHAIPADTVPYHREAPETHLHATIGSQGGNTTEALTLAQCGREHKKTMTENAAEALAKKEAERHAAAVQEITLGQMVADMERMRVAHAAQAARRR